MQPKERLPVLLHYEDNSTESKDAVATAGGGARLTGSLLKFDEKDKTHPFSVMSRGVNIAETNTGKSRRNLSLNRCLAHCDCAIMT